MAISVLRLGHRSVRDKRISTHVALVARAFGASALYYSGEHDSEMEQSIGKVVKAWGGPFKVEHVQNWRSFIKNFKGEKIQLTMYGLSFEKYKKTNKDKLIIVGGSKVPWDVYELVDSNLAVTNQPHSEVSALGVFLDKYAKKPIFKNAKQKIKPSARGKEMVRK